MITVRLAFCNVFVCGTVGLLLADAYVQFLPHLRAPFPPELLSSIGGLSHVGPIVLLRI